MINMIHQLEVLQTILFRSEVGLDGTRKTCNYNSNLKYCKESIDYDSYFPYALVSFPSLKSFFASISQ